MTSECTAQALAATLPGHDAIVQVVKRVVVWASSD